jgi:adenylate cyclase class 2
VNHRGGTPRAVGYPERVKKAQEVEVKIAATSATALRKRLRNAEFQIRAPRVFEQNIALDDATQRLFRTGLLLRLRSAGKKVLCTFKGPVTTGRHKKRDEYEFHADDLNACLAVFGGLGYHPSFRYEKYRTEFARGGERGCITLDETPIGLFLELEGPPRWIDAAAKTLGFSPADYITASYTELYFEWCRAHDLQPGDMVFAKGSTA